MVLRTIDILIGSLFLLTSLPPSLKQTKRVWLARLQVKKQAEEAAAAKIAAEEAAIEKAASDARSVSRSFMHSFTAIFFLCVPLFVQVCLRPFHTP